MEILIAVIPASVAAVASVLCALITSGARQAQKESAREAHEYRSQRERLDKAKWKVLIATMEGVTVLLHQARGEQLNGNVEDALEGISAAEAELSDVQAGIFAQL